MDLQNLSEWLKMELQRAGFRVNLSDVIAEKGLVGDPGWVEIGWRAEIDFLGGEQIPEGEFDRLGRFQDLADLIKRRQEQLSWSKTAILSAA